MDKNGNYKQQEESEDQENPSVLSIEGIVKRLKYLTQGKGKKDTIGDLIIEELESIEQKIKEEKALLLKASITEREKGKRLLYLFQKDLMPGINGMILESKDKRDNMKMKGSSRTAKVMSWIFLASANIGMLFYILLFALSQDSHRQQAWGQSFALWLVVEVLLVSSLAVIIMNVWIPSLVMKDLGNIKKKLMVNVITFYQNMAKNENRGEVYEEIGRASCRERV